MPVRFLFLATIAALTVSAQSVVSVRSGLVNFSEGEVFLADQPVEQKAGKFPELREGDELRTEAGRAEVLLTPGMLLRVGPDSAIRMLSASLIDTRVEFRRGSAIVELSQDPDGTMARVNYRDYQIRFPKRGIFRIDSTPREFRVYEGEAEISYLGERATLIKDKKVSLYGGLEAETLRRSITDGLDEWSMRRDTQIEADNPPPGDLDGTADPGFFLPALPFYTYPGAYSSPYSYSSTYSPGYIPPFAGYGSYGFVQTLPIYIHQPSRPIVGRYPSPYRPLPYRPPSYGGPIPVRSHPVAAPIRPVTPARPVSVTHK